MVLIQIYGEAYSLKGRSFPLQNPLKSGSSSQHWESSLNDREHIPRFYQSVELQNLSIIS